MLSDGEAVQRVNSLWVWRVLLATMVTCCSKTPLVWGQQNPCQVTTEPVQSQFPCPVKSYTPQTQARVQPTPVTSATYRLVYIQTNDWHIKLQQIYLSPSSFVNNGTERPRLAPSTHAEFTPHFSGSNSVPGLWKSPLFSIKLSVFKRNIAGW